MPMPEVYLMSYATPNFTAKQQELIASARAQGIANLVSYAQADLRRTAFYRQHRRATYERWAASVPRDFRFAVKIPKTMTHENRLRRARRPR